MSKLFSKKFLAVIALVFALTAGSQAFAATVINPTSVALNKNTGVIGAEGGYQFQLTANVLPDTAADKSIIWTSSNPDAVTVDVYGMATIGGMNKGIATIYATTKYGGKFTKTILKVAEGTRDIQLSTPILHLKLGQDPYAEKVTFIPSTTKYKTLEWKSDNDAVATVDQKGLITPVGVGVVTIHVTNKSVLGDVASSLTVNVIPSTGALPVDVKSLQIVKPDLQTIKIGSKITLKTTVYPATALNKTLTYESSEPTTASVTSAGVVTALAVGDVSILVTTANGVSDSINLSVTQPVTSLSLVGNKTATLKIGETKQVNVTSEPSTASNTILTWISSNAGVAVVESGLITAVSSGTTTITGTTADGSNKVISLVITVPVNVTGVLPVFPKVGNYGYVIGKQLTLKSAISPSNATDKTVIWDSSDKAVATVSSLGVVTPLKEGESIIALTSRDGSFTKTVKIRVVDLTAWSKEASYMIMYSL
jgi:uncharacterized protein YjdB